MNVEDTSSTDVLRSNEKCDTPESRTSSENSSASKLYLKSDGSKENVLNFKETQSPLREKDTSLSTTPEIVVGGGMETS